MVSTAGSPPHTRGKEHGSQRRGHFRGITPAHAGKRREHSEIFFRARDHPRTRGEKESQGPHWCRPRGSPPHTRGKVSDLENLNFDLRITPAHAGKSIRPGEPKLRPEDHPRTHGEKHGMESTSHIRQGSPPHTRGKAPTYSNWANWDRITPAHTGKSFASDLCGESGRDHPRACGEKVGQSSRKQKLRGSPPRVRGKATGRHKESRLPGITPARAGKRGRFKRPNALYWDHPRACGEKEEERRTNARHWGSPPRVRGKGQVPGGAGSHTGITPARAGKRYGYDCRRGQQ